MNVLHKFLKDMDKDRIIEIGKWAGLGLAALLGTLVLGLLGLVFLFMGEAVGLRI